MLALIFLIAAAAASGPDAKECKMAEVAKQRYIPGYDAEYLGDTSLKKCKKVCLTTTKYNCASFSYDASIRNCWLYEVNRTSVELSFSENAIYYEKSCRNQPKSCIATGETIDNPDAKNKYDIVDHTSLAREHGSVTKIVVYSGNIVDRIQVTYGTHEAMVGDQSGGHPNIIDLDDAEVITEISAQTVESGNEYYPYCLIDLKFRTSNNREFGPYGSATGSGDGVINSTSDGLFAFQFGYDPSIQSKYAPGQECLKMITPITKKSCRNQPKSCIATGETIDNPDVKYDIVDQTSLAREHGSVTKIVVHSGTIVDGIQVTYGTHGATVVGAVGGGQNIIDLDSDEVITEISAQTLGSGDPYWPYCLVDLKFRTSNNREFGPYGYGTGDGVINATSNGLFAFQFGYGSDNVNNKACLRMITPITKTC